MPYTVVVWVIWLYFIKLCIRTSQSFQCIDTAFISSSFPPSLSLDQNHRKHIVQTFKPTPESSSFQRPQSDMNVASGCPQFTKLSTLDDDNYVKDDVMYIKCIVDTSRIFHPWLGDQKLKLILTSRHGLVLKLWMYQIWLNIVVVELYYTLNIATLPVLGWCNNALGCVIHSASSHALHNLECYCIILVHTH